MVRCAIRILKPQEIQVHLCSTVSTFARGSTSLAHLVSLLVKVGSMIPSSSRHLDTVHHLPHQTAATKEGALYYLLMSC